MLRTTSRTTVRLVILGLVVLLLLTSASSAMAKKPVRTGPVVRAEVVDVYWENDDPCGRLLNVEWRFTNVGTQEAYESRIFFECSNGATYVPGQPHTPFGMAEPTHFYSLQPGDSVVSATHFIVPNGVKRFTVTPAGDCVFGDELFNTVYPLYNRKKPNGTWRISKF